MLRATLIARLFAFAAPAAKDAAPIRVQEFAAMAGLRFELRNGEAGAFHQIELTVVASLPRDRLRCLGAGGGIPM